MITNEKIKNELSSILKTLEINESFDSFFNNFEKEKVYSGEVKQENTTLKICESLFNGV